MYSFQKQAKKMDDSFDSVHSDNEKPSYDVNPEDKVFKVIVQEFNNIATVTREL